MLGGRTLYKTKMCVLYKSGRCSRPNCKFAHGEAELRRFSGGGSSSFNGRRDYRSGDLRDKLNKRSPNRRYSPQRDASSHHAFGVQKPLPRDRGSSSSRSPVRRSARGYRRKQRVDAESDDSQNLKISNGAEVPKEEDRAYDKKYEIKKQLKQIQSEVKNLEDNKSRLEDYLEEKIADEHNLSTRIQELEIQLSKEQEVCERITSKVKEFVRAHWRHLKAQEELKQSQAGLQELGDQLDSEILKIGIHEGDSSDDFPSDGELNGDNKRSRSYHLKNDALSMKKRASILSATTKEARVGNSQKRGRFSGSTSKSEKSIRSVEPAHQLKNDEKGTEPKRQNREVIDKSSLDHIGGKSCNISTVALEAKVSDDGQVLPSSSIAAHAVDDHTEATEMEDRPEAVEGIASYDNEAVDNKARSFYMLPPPPPPINPNAYNQYEGDDEDVDVEGVDSETLDVDLNGDVEIE